MKTSSILFVGVVLHAFALALPAATKPGILRERKNSDAS
jgi:hypothetical protein